MSRIVAYAYSEGANTGLPHPPYASTSTLGIIEQATPATITYARPTAARPFYAPESAADQARDWVTVLNALTPAGLYAITYDAATQRVTIASTNATPFRPVMVENLALWLGFSATLAGWATSWLAPSAPACVAGLLTATVEPAEDAARVDLHEYRHGRAVAVAWGNHQLHKITLHFTSASLRIFDPGFLLTGRVRIYQGSDTTDYSPTNVDGVIDGWVIASDNPNEDGDLGECWYVDCLVAVARG